MIFSTKLKKIDKLKIRNKNRQPALQQAAHSFSRTGSQILCQWTSTGYPSYVQMDWIKSIKAEIKHL